MVDSLSEAALGVHLFPMTFAGYLAGKTAALLKVEGPTKQAVVVAIILLAYMLTRLLMVDISQQLSFWYALFGPGISELLLTLIFTPVVFLLLDNSRELWLGRR